MTATVTATGSGHDRAALCRRIRLGFEQAMTSKTGLILEAVTVLVEYLLVVGRESDDELLPGDVEAAVASGQITVEQMAARFAQELSAKLPEAPPPWPR